MYSSQSSIEEWKQLVAGSRQLPSASAQGSGNGASQQAFIDWREQPPRKRAKQQQQQQQPKSAASPKQQPTATTHKEVEKQRRDRMNQAISSLSRLIPAAYLKQGQSRVEKAEVIELAAQHMLALTSQLERCRAALGPDFPPASGSNCCAGQFYQGYRECSKAAINYLTQQPGFSTTDNVISGLRSHLQEASQRYLPTPSSSEEPLADRRDNQRQAELTRRRRWSRESCSRCSTDEAPGSSGSEADADIQGQVDGGRGRVKPDSAEPRSDPKTAFKRRFEKESASTTATNANTDQPDDEAPLLPGFVLHESGTHYLPLVVPPSALGTELITSKQPPLLLSGRRRDSSPLLHPVSIPVNFGATRFVRCNLKPAN